MDRVHNANRNHRLSTEIDQYGSRPRRAIIGAADRHWRPVVLTRVTTVAGLIPLRTGGGPLREPMAVPIFGLLFATARTLGVVPIHPLRRVLRCSV